jgi:hypothetical protein
MRNAFPFTEALNSRLRGNDNTDFTSKPVLVISSYDIPQIIQRKRRQCNHPHPGQKNKCL